MSEQRYGDCAAMDLARRIAAWVGDGKPVTPKGVLKPGDVRQAAAALQMPLPEKFRSGGDVPSWHVPWSVALATGMLVVERGRATGRSVEITSEVWLTGFVAALTAMCDDEDGVAAARIGRTVLTALATGKAPTGEQLCHFLWHELDYEQTRLLHSVGYDEVGDALLDLFAGFGVVGQRGELTELGKWASAEMTSRGDGVVRRDVIPADQICQLKISLERMSPPCWRRVLVQAGDSLGNLHWVIQAAMRWDDDHLHDFTVGSHRYGNPAFDMEGEDDVVIGEVFTASRKTIRYTYDFGDDWRHEILLEGVLDAGPEVTYPVCVAGSGAVPVEDTQYKTIKFDQDDINQRLSGPRVEEGDPMLEKVVEMIVVDAYGEDEQLAAFQAVFDSEVKVPAKATLLGNTITVLEFDYADPLRGVFVRCREGEVSLVDVTFPPGTVAAWVHAAYRDFLGLEPFPAEPKPDWSWPNW